MTRTDELKAAYDRGVITGQEFIDRHPHGFPGPTVSDYGPPEPSEDELERERRRGWYERVGEQIGTKEDPRESWREKMQAYRLWPDDLP